MGGNPKNGVPAAECGDVLGGYAWGGQEASGGFGCLEESCLYRAIAIYWSVDKNSLEHQSSGKKKDVFYLFAFHPLSTLESGLANLSFVQSCHSVGGQEVEPGTPLVYGERPGSAMARWL